jgi:hypothetical protein
LKKSTGKSLLLVFAAGTASQLISRRPPVCEPGVFALSVPSALRNAFTLAVMSPEPVNTVACTWALSECMATASCVAGAVPLGADGRLRLHAPSVAANITAANTR